MLGKKKGVLAVSPRETGNERLKASRPRISKILFSAVVLALQTIGRRRVPRINRAPWMGRRGALPHRQRAALSADEVEPLLWERTGARLRRWWDGASPPLGRRRRFLAPCGPFGARRVPKQGFPLCVGWYRKTGGPTGFRPRLDRSLGPALNSLPNATIFRARENERSPESMKLNIYILRVHFKKQTLQEAMDVGC